MRPPSWTQVVQKAGGVAEGGGSWIPANQGAGTFQGGGLGIFRAATGMPGYGGGGGPNYGDLIGGDWEVQFAEGDMAAQMARAKAAFRKSLNQGLIDLGVVDMGKLGGLGQYIDKNTISQAANNKYSYMAKVAQEELRNKSQTNAALAGRGILTSGQTTKSATDIIAAAEGARYSALRDFLQGGEQGLFDLANLESELGWRLAQARAAAAARAAQTYPWWEEGGGGARPGTYTPAGSQFWPQIFGGQTWGGPPNYGIPTKKKPKFKLPVGGIGTKPM